MTRKKADYRQRLDFDKRFNRELRSLEKIIRDAKIVGETLSVATSKVNANIIIRPYEANGIIYTWKITDRIDVMLGWTDALYQKL